MQVHDYERLGRAPIMHNEGKECPEMYPLPESGQATEVDQRDKNCPDSWVPRRSELIRLTGLHPFNCEPPLADLMKGFITPPSLHYVRNHGPVPRIDWDTHRVQIVNINGDTVGELCMDDLVSKFPHRTLPVTLTCAGNRRMEQNAVKKSNGFSWGCAAVSTSVWKGVRMSDVLEHFGVLDQLQKIQYVNIEGVDVLPKGRYGTSIAIETVLDPSRDVILAFEQNGEKLLPDHGYPVRVLVPGYIGGRMVKWLGKIQVSDVQSDSYYHYMDNRVLPPQVTTEQAEKERWWYKPEFIINDRNINSVISTPAHKEVISLATTGALYTLKGYAYNGGGRKVTRVELSFDYGTTWELAQVDTREKPTPYGKYWCWSFWSMQCDPSRFLGTKEIAVRAWDESQNTQPGNLTWNLLGMCNNPWFRVKIYPTRTENGLAIMFKHPATVQDGGGWMMEQKSSHIQKPKLQPGQRQIKMLEVQRHTSHDDCWVVIAGNVYDVTKWLKLHPGGEASIMSLAGQDCTRIFNTIHSKEACAMLDKWQIGQLAEMDSKI
mmetsp:Transcript_4601/g.8039  ORF Transcript_4601/g.8039 Transcript_4601/m.8039 type:complete len:546 (+) Transcript_4601:2190-3827(+)